MYQSIISTLEAVKRDILNEYHSKKLKASGDFERNITIARQGRYKVVMTLPSYSQFIMKFKGNRGGSKGMAGPLGTIEKWVKDKGLSLRDYTTGRFMARTDTNIKKVAFLIRRKIMNPGTDIYIGKRQPIDLDRIVDNVFDYKGEEIAERILQQIKL